MKHFKKDFPICGQTVKRIADDTCPVCGHGNCEGDDTEYIDGDSFYQRMECPNCAASWSNGYTLTRQICITDGRGQECEDVELPSAREIAALAVSVGQLIETLDAKSESEDVIDRQRAKEWPRWVKRAVKVADLLRADPIANYEKADKGYGKIELEIAQ